jgi:MFS family permease
MRTRSRGVGKYLGEVTLFAWMKDLTAKERRTLGACIGGWGMDAFDLNIYGYAIPTLIAAWGISNTQAGLIGTVTYLVSSIGGWIAGTLSDRVGRVRMLQITILWYAFFTAICGFAQNFEQLLILRALQGIGFGGEWGVGAVLMAEVIRAKYRGRAVGVVQSGYALGWGLSALVYTGLFASLPESIAWRCLFWVGAIPALLVFWIRRYVPEPELYEKVGATRSVARQFFSVFDRRYLWTTIRLSLLITGIQGGGTVLVIWLPTYLRTVRGLSAVGTGGYIVALICGAFVGFLLGALLADGIGRKLTFAISGIGSSLMMTIYTIAPISNDLILPIGFILGIFVFSAYSPIGSFTAEMFPTQVRGTGQGFTYSFGRAMGSTFATIVGYLSQHGVTLGMAMGTMALSCYLLMLVFLMLVPETRGRNLEVLE